MKTVHTLGGISMLGLSEEVRERAGPLVKAVRASSDTAIDMLRDAHNNQAQGNHMKYPNYGHAYEALTQAAKNADTLADALPMGSDARVVALEVGHSLRQEAGEALGKAPVSYRYNPEPESGPVLADYNR